MNSKQVTHFGRELSTKVLLAASRSDRAGLALNGLRLPREGRDGGGGGKRDEDGAEEHFKRRNE